MRLAVSDFSERQGLEKQGSEEESAHCEGVLHACKAVKLFGECFSSPVVFGGTVFVGCRDDYLYCIRWFDTDTSVRPWLQYQTWVLSFQLLQRCILTHSSAHCQVVRWTHWLLSKFKADILQQQIMFENTSSAHWTHHIKALPEVWHSLKYQWLSQFHVAVKSARDSVEFKTIYLN